jgi:hypothetical protein
MIEALGMLSPPLETTFLIIIEVGE